jgi:hypothetical protein
VVEAECWALLQADVMAPRFEFDRLPAPNDSYVRILSEPGRQTTYHRTSLCHSASNGGVTRSNSGQVKPVVSEMVDPLNLAYRPNDLGVLLRYCPPVNALSFSFFLFVSTDI